MNLLNELDHVKIRIASPEKILEWSYGEVKEPETINYKSLKPVKDGLFCERIFGPIKDWHCSSTCGVYKKVRPKEKGKVCEKCGVEITRSDVRRERMGHIRLAAPVAHFWYFHSRNFISALLDLPAKKLKAIIYCKAHVVTDPGDTPLEKMQLLVGEEHEEALMMYKNREEYPRPFKSGIGAGVIKELLEEIDLDALAKELQAEIQATKTKKREKLMKRLKIVDVFRRSHSRPEWMILEYLPVTPPDIRPMVQLDGGKFATSDVNDLYRRVINRNNRLKKLIKLDAPELIIENEKRILQEAVDSLIDNARKKPPTTARNGRVLKSMSDSLTGKQGRFRQNLLGKRVDYSGRSVITVGPKLRLHQCGIPWKMALELFTPMVTYRLVELGLASNVKVALKKIKEKDHDVWDVLEEVVRGYPVILNRAPTLHRLSVRAFEPILIDGHAIRLHPLVCAAFNADFDGDQMAVHIPVSVEAQIESRVLLLAPENLLHPQNGESANTPSQDMILGCHYLTMERSGVAGEGKYFSSPQEAIASYEAGHLSLHAKIIVDTEDMPKISRGSYLVTTVGKLLFNQNLPTKLVYLNDSRIEKPVPSGVFDRIEEAFAYLPIKENKPVDKKFLVDLISYTYDHLGKKETTQMLDEIKDLGFHYATKAGITISYSDVHTPEVKKELLERAEKEKEAVEDLYRYGRISEDDRYDKVVDIWNKVGDEIADASMKLLSEEEMNPIRMMIESGARGSKSQYKQLGGMRGLMADPSGRTIEKPIKANFAEGLTEFEYFISTHGARKGLADTSLKTADSGYLTRIMVDVAQDIVVTEDDCGTEDYLFVSSITPQIESLQERIVGRTLGMDVKGKDGAIHRKDTLIDKPLAEELASLYDEVPIRTLLTCETSRGVCKTCYGVDLSTRHIVEVGEAVGVVAAQSIGEPGTQLTMRTFHTGGVAGDDITQGLPRIKEIVEARKSPKGEAVLSKVQGKVAIEEKGILKEVVVYGEEVERYEIPYGYSVVVKEGEDVEIGQRLTQGSINPHELLALKGLKAAQSYLIEEVQRVYRRQGVKINDKHIEVIVRQMSRKVVVESSPDPRIIPERVMERSEVRKRNKELRKKGLGDIIVRDKLLGITEASLSTESFLSAASFQETPKILTNAAIKGSMDRLFGLKENIITGKRIPAGTGFPKYDRREETE